MDVPASIENSVLGLLYTEPFYGYELYRKYARRTGLSLIWKVKRSHLYSILGRFAREGLVETEILEQENYPARKVYRLTEEGRRSFRAWMTSPVPDSRSFRVEFPAKLLFARSVDPIAARNLLAEQRRICAAWLRDKEKSRGIAEGDTDSSNFDALVYRFRAGQIRAMVDWLEDCEETLSLANLESPG